MNPNDLVLNTTSALLKLNLYNYSELHDNICQIIYRSLPGINFTSLLTYNKKTDEIIYNAIYFDVNTYNKSIITDFLRDKIVLRVDSSTSGRLIDSNNDILPVDNVLVDKDFKSTELAIKMNLKKAIFLKLRELKTEEIYGVFIIYPTEDSPINELFGPEQYTILISTIENIISNAKRLKEDNILTGILAATKKVKKDLSSFLQKCVEIISKELNVRGCSIFIVDPIDNLVKLKATLGVKPGKLYKNKYINFTKQDVYYRLGEGITGKIAENNEMVVRHMLDTSNSKWLEKEMSTTFLGIPIPKIGEDKAIGVIRCATKPNTLLNSKIEAFNHEDIEMINFIAKIISTFIEISFYQDNQRQMMTKMPHELRASLNNIMNLSCLIEVYYGDANKRGCFIEHFEQKIDDIMDECNLSLMTIKSLAAFEDDFTTYEYSLTDLPSEIIKIRKLLSNIAKIEKGITIKYIKNVEFPNLFIDKYRMQLVFHNLILNAIKYSNRRHNKNIIIEDNISKDNSFYTVSISNYGIPIADKHKNDIFLYGFRTMEAREINPAGKGFGLTLVKTILAGHESKIEVTNLYNPTTFTIFFPKKLSFERPNINL